MIVEQAEQRYAKVRQWFYSSVVIKKAYSHKFRRGLPVTHTLVEIWNGRHMWSVWKASGSSSVRVTIQTAGKKREDEYGENFL